MKYITLLFVAFIFMTSATAQKSPSVIFTLNDIKPDSLKNDKVYLYFSIENTGSETVILNNPASFGNTKFILKEGNKTLSYAIRVKLNPAHERVPVTIAPHSKLEVRHDYPLNKLFVIDPAKGHSYTLYLSYKGIVSNTISF